jgi:enoyl-CoA hydratase/carnithine racemase
MDDGTVGTDGTDGPGAGAGVDIEVEWRGGVAVVQWRDGENRLNRRSVATLNAVLDDLLERAGDGPLAMVLTGEGKFFSNGLDLDWMLAAPDEANGFLAEVHALFARFLLFPAVTVAAINGHAFAAGAMLAAAHDFCVMRDDRGYWCLPEVDLGLPLTPAMAAVITAKLPKLAAHEAIMTGKRFTAAEAHDAGIVHRIASHGAVVDTAVALAAELAPKSREVTARHKQLLYGDTAALCVGDT